MWCEVAPAWALRWVGQFAGSGKGPAASFWPRPCHHRDAKHQKGHTSQRGDPAYLG